LGPASENATYLPRRNCPYRGRSGKGAMFVPDVMHDLGKKLREGKNRRPSGGDPASCRKSQDVHLLYQTREGDGKKIGIQRGAGDGPGRNTGGRTSALRRRRAIFRGDFCSSSCRRSYIPNKKKGRNWVGPRKEGASFFRKSTRLQRNSGKNLRKRS